jgi:hypothetical protein
MWSLNTAYLNVFNVIVLKNLCEGINDPKIWVINTLQGKDKLLIPEYTNIENLVWKFCCEIFESIEHKPLMDERELMLWLKDTMEAIKSKNENSSENTTIVANDVDSVSSTSSKN